MTGESNSHGTERTGIGGDDRSRLKTWLVTRKRTLRDVLAARIELKDIFARCLSNGIFFILCLIFRRIYLRPNFFYFFGRYKACLESRLVEFEFRFAVSSDVIFIQLVYARCTMWFSALSTDRLHFVWTLYAHRWMCTRSGRLPLGFSSIIALYYVLNHVTTSRLQRFALKNDLDFQPLANDNGLHASCTREIFYDTCKIYYDIFLVLLFHARSRRALLRK